MTQKHDAGGGSCLYVTVDRPSRASDASSPTRNARNGAARRGRCPPAEGRTWRTGWGAGPEAGGPGGEGPPGDGAPGRGRTRVRRPPSSRGTLADIIPEAPPCSTTRAVLVRKAEPAIETAIALQENGCREGRGRPYQRGRRNSADSSGASSLDDYGGYGLALGYLGLDGAQRATEYEDQRYPKTLLHERLLSTGKSVHPTHPEWVLPNIRIIAIT